MPHTKRSEMGGNRFNSKFDSIYWLMPAVDFRGTTTATPTSIQLLVNRWPLVPFKDNRIPWDHHREAYLHSNISLQETFGPIEGQVISVGPPLERLQLFNF